MNETFKTELAAFARDLNALCNMNARCSDCPYRNKNGWCAIGINGDQFDADKAIHAVEAYRKRKKPRKTVVDAADDIVQVKVIVHRHNRNALALSLETALSEIKSGIEAGIEYMCRDVKVDTEILSSERVVLRSHEEDNEDE